VPGAFCWQAIREAMSVQRTVGEVARLARVSVHTLHHYDAVGLLPPSGRSEAGYRLYTAPDLERLQQILLFRELGFALAEIRRIMLDPGFDRRRALSAQRALLADRARRLDAMRAAIDDALDALQKGIRLAPDDPAVQALADRHWHHLARWFYTPTPEMYAGLGDLYVSDPRFTKNIDKAREGLAACQQAAMRSYAQAGRRD
jgi:DNA-binding transcriptional MerR regulator